MVNLYPFAKAAARPDLPFDDLVEEIDIGGPSLVRAAAKNFRDVLVVVEPADYDRVLEALAVPRRPVRSRCASTWRGARLPTPRRTTRRSRPRWRQVTVDDDRRFSARSGDAAGSCRHDWSPDLAKLRDLRYGENPHQPAAWYRGAPAIAASARPIVHQGKELSFTNLLDLDAAARIALEFAEPAAVVIKHTNPCGVATGGTARRSLRPRTRGRCACRRLAASSG